MNANKREKTRESVVCNIQYQYYIVHMHMQSAELYNATAAMVHVLGANIR